MTLRGTLKALGLMILLPAAVVAVWYSIAYIVIGVPRMKLVGLVVFIAAFRAIILAFDLMWGRPPVWSKDPGVRATARNPEGFRHH